jgi:hypothetical protein
MTENASESTTLINNAKPILINIISFYCTDQERDATQQQRRSADRRFWFTL